MIIEELVGGEVGTCSPGTPIAEAATQMIADDVGSLVVIPVVYLLLQAAGQRLVHDVAEGMARAPRHQLQFGSDVIVEGQGSAHHWKASFRT